jgi:glutamate racemase
MLRTISARIARPAGAYHGNRVDHQRSSIGTSIRLWTRPSAFGDLARTSHRVARRHIHTGHGSFSPGPKRHVSDEIRNNIVVAGKIYTPPAPQASALNVGEYKAAARSLIARAGELITVAPQQGLYDLSRKTIADNLLQAMHTVAHADKVMIVTGRNTADGKVTIDGPVSAAVAAHALYESRKVAVIMCDAINQRLIRRLLEQINPACARYMKYLPINEVNGKLFGALSKHIVTQAPDVTLYIDVPGRNGSGHYFDEHGKSIGMSNVAFDQALNIQNSLGKATIAICRSPNNAGMPETDTTVVADGEDVRARLMSAMPLVVGDIVDGTLALMELVSNACTDMSGCTPGQLQALLKTAIDITEDKAFTAPAMRRIGRPREQRNDAAPVTVESRASAVSRLGQLQKLVDARPVTWPASLDKLKLEGAETRYAVLYDSSDGVLIATDDFLGFVRARSHLHLKVMLVADHNKASYGDWCKDELFTIVVDGMVFSAMQGPDVVTMVCNTACTTELTDRVRVIVEKALAAAGKHTRVQIVDLIATTSRAIIDEGGSRPVLLSTEGTAKSGKYKLAVKRIAHEDGLEEPDMLVIGCGDKAIRPGHDLAALINKGAHLDVGSADFRLLEREIFRYVEQIALNATSIWLCCTHFPILRELIRKAMNDRLLAHGLAADSIPIIDPIEFQAEATVAALRQAGPSSRDYSKLADITVATTGLPGVVMKATQRYIKSQKNVPVMDVFFPKVNVAELETVNGCDR